MTEAPLTIEPFSISLPDDVLDDLYGRLRNTRWAPDPGNEELYYGVSTAYLQELVEYWLTEFDWRRAEAAINEFSHFRTVIEDQPFHFIREAGKGPDPVPIVISHGWPWTFWDINRVIRPLADPAAYGGDPADAFDVIVPSLGGYGFSTPARPDMNFWKTADIIHTLMTKGLGYERFAASGGDQGAQISAQLSHKYAEDVLGVHLTMDLPPNWIDLVGGEFWSLGSLPPGLPDELRQEWATYLQSYVSHLAVHMLDAQPLSLGLNDSPVGMLAWILQRWRRWSDQSVPFESLWTRDHMLTNATIYWATQAIGTSIRTYRNIVRYPWVAEHDRQPMMEAPVGFTFLAGDFPPGATMDTRVDLFKNGPTGSFYNTVFANTHEKGGHFAHLENPDAVVDDIRAMFRPLR